MDYLELRERLYGPLRSVFSWDWLEGEEYGLAGIHFITREFREELSQATYELGKIFARVVCSVQDRDDRLLLELGIPPEALGAVRIQVMNNAATTIGRFDFAHTAQGPKMLEFNADTPTSVVEAFFVNQQACDFFGTENPNVGMERHIEAAFGAVVERYRLQGYQTESIVFSALGWHNEDRDTTRYLLNQSGLRAKFVPLENLRVIEGRLWAITEGGPEPVDVLFRLHALEKLAVEKDTDGFPTGACVLDMIARKKLAVINPPSAFIAQTKALQALIWGLHEEGEFFSAEEHAVIEGYMLPTYLENRFSGKSNYVIKPIFGAICARIGERITGNLSCYLPVGIR